MASQPSKISLAARRATAYNVDAERPAGDRWATMSNALVNASQSLSLPEKQIIMLAISKLDSRKAMQPGQLPTARLTGLELAEAFGVDQSLAYKALRDAVNNLYERSIIFREQAYSRKKTGNPPGFVNHSVRWLSSKSSYAVGQGWCDITFTQEVMPHLTALKARFTSYRLKQAVGLRSLYSWRLLEKLNSFGRDGGQAVIEIGDFCHSMEATPKQQENFAAIRRKMIEPAVAELETKDGWEIEWRPNKTGRKVTSLSFSWKRTSQPDLFNQDPQKATEDDDLPLPKGPQPEFG
jgi:plasmid replication initiation protein